MSEERYSKKKKSIEHLRGPEVQKIDGPVEQMSHDIYFLIMGRYSRRIVYYVNMYSFEVDGRRRFPAIYI